MFRTATTVAYLGLLAAAASPAAAAQSDVRTLRGDAAVYNLVGTITAEPAVGAEIVVEVTSGSRRVERRSP